MTDFYCPNCGMVQEAAEDACEELQKALRKVKEKIRRLEKAIDETGRLDSARIAGVRTAKGGRDE